MIHCSVVLPLFTIRVFVVRYEGVVSLELFKPR